MTASISSIPKNFRTDEQIFKTVMGTYASDNFEARVKVNDIRVSDRPNAKSYDSLNLAVTDDGFVFMSNVNSIEETVGMANASRSYQTNVQVMNATKMMMMSTLQLGR